MESACMPAIVTAIEDIGKIKLTVFPPNGMPQHKQGVLHKTHPAHKQRNNPQSVRSGMWDFSEPQKDPYRAAYERAEVKLSAKEKHDDSILKALKGEPVDA